MMKTFLKAVSFAPWTNLALIFGIVALAAVIYVLYVAPTYAVFALSTILVIVLAVIGSAIVLHFNRQ